MINLALAIVTVLVLIVAAIMSLVAWTTKRDERRRAAARVAWLAAAIHEHGDTLPLRPRRQLTTSAPGSSSSRHGRRHEACRHRRRRGARRRRSHRTCAAGGKRFRAAARRAPGSARVEQPARVPLELVALEHDRDDSRLIVRGIVRNPASAVTLNGLTAVVLVFSKDGGFIASERAPVAVTALVPGAETPFVVTLPDADSRRSLSREFSNRRSRRAAHRSAWPERDGTNRMNRQRFALTVAAAATAIVVSLHAQQTPPQNPGDPIPPSVFEAASS